MTAPVLGPGGEVVTVPLSEAIAHAERRYGRLSKRWSFLPPATPEEKRVCKNKSGRESWQRWAEKNPDKVKANQRRQREKRKGAAP